MNDAIERISLPLFNPLISPVSLYRGAISRCISAGAENYLLNKFIGLFPSTPRSSIYRFSLPLRFALVEHATPPSCLWRQRPRTSRAFLKDPTNPDRSLKAYRALGFDRLFLDLTHDFDIVQCFLHFTRYSVEDGGI